MSNVPERVFWVGDVWSVFRVAQTKPISALGSRAGRWRRGLGACSSLGIILPETLLACAFRLPEIESTSERPHTAGDCQIKAGSRRGTTRDWSWSGVFSRIRLCIWKTITKINKVELDYLTSVKCNLQRVNLKMSSIVCFPDSETLHFWSAADQELVPVTIESRTITFICFCCLKWETSPLPPLHGNRVLTATLRDRMRLFHSHIHTQATGSQLRGPFKFSALDRRATLFTLAKIRDRDVWRK